MSTENTAVLTTAQKNHIFENMSDAIMTVGINSEISYMNSTCAQLFEIDKELADSLDNYPCHNCKHGSERCEWCGTAQELDVLVAKARKMIGGTE